LILQRGVSDSTAYTPASNTSTSELDDDDQYRADELAAPKEIEVMESDAEERKMKWGRLLTEFVKGAWKIVTLGAMCVSLHSYTLCSSSA